MMKFFYKVFRSFGYATEGILSAFGERNMRVHVGATIVVIMLGFYVQLSFREWTEVMMLIAMVWSAEMINTAVEELANLVRDELKLSYTATKRARDVAAGAVLVVAFIAFLIGLRIFVPKLFL